MMTSYISSIDVPLTALNLQLPKNEVKRIFVAHDDDRTEMNGPPRRGHCQQEFHQAEMYQIADR